MKTANLTIQRRKGSDKNKALTGYDSEFLIDGATVCGITAASLSFLPDEPVIASVDLLSSDIQCSGITVRWHLTHPATGERKEIEQVIFKDGTKWPEAS